VHSFFPREARAKNAAAQTGPSDELDESSVTRDVGRMILFSQPFPGEPRPTFRRPSAPLGDCQNRGHGAGDVTSGAPVTPVSAGDHKIYAVAGGNHVTIELDRALTGGLLDVIEVFAQPGGGPPPHRHSFGEWFLVREGELTLCEERDGQVVTTAVLGPGDSAWVGPGVVHRRPVPASSGKSQPAGASSSGPGPSALHAAADVPLTRRGSDRRVEGSDAGEAGGSAALNSAKPGHRGRGR
jgi:quercetin dioxygenase-like cupin family protein